VNHQNVNVIIQLGQSVHQIVVSKTPYNEELVNSAQLKQGFAPKQNASAKFQNGQRARNHAALASKPKQL